ncbi:MAG TPA: hypothetical protein VMT86_08250 [Bryobacteraceae bacterium]|nr:hypothetical protein [Bryobacteraceae bacterium]
MRHKISAALTAASCVFLLAAPVLAANKPNKPMKSAERTAWPAETLSGKIVMVKPALKLAVVKGPDGVPFDMIVTHSTLIRANGQKLSLSGLSSDVNKKVSVKFVPEGRGDVARTIHVNG